MSASVTLEEAQSNLSGLIEKLAPGEQIIITRDQQAVARLVAERPAERKPRVPGNCKGMIVLAFEDDEHLKDFGEYMP
jgi:antitoxin (DNA-binding transcriptional repressor) of toxin-antitoxin stability system